ncbi:MAG: hypothetical protein OIF48_12695 [Silicimonas sp.]|nr:hypothetical protein [Silicimonas sp.]
MADQESFISEVNEEVRRDRLYKLMRRYGWIAIAAVVAVVGGASVLEWQKSKARAAAEATGDALLAALESGAPEAQQAALAAIDAGDSAEKAALVGLLHSASAVEAGDDAAARAALIEIVNNGAAPQVYRDLARLKAVLIPGADPSERIALLEPIMVPGNPFRLLAVEQRALAEVAQGETAAALETLNALIVDAEATESLRRRARQVIVALGGSLEES